jgi:parvulin-like peptidyl-prolyl isomerase
MNYPIIRAVVWLLCVTAPFFSTAPIQSADSLFNDPVVAKGKGFQIRESDLDEAYVGHKAAAAAMGQNTPPALEPQLKKQLLDKMIASRLFLARATAADLDNGKKMAASLIAESKQKAGSEGSYRRRLTAVGSSPQKYEAELTEQAIVQAVVDRELKRLQPVPEADVKKFYDDHPDLYAEPEKARVAQILFATRKIPNGEPLPLEERVAKKNAADKATERARKGEDFTKLVRELSDDPESKTKNGEIVFTRDSGVVPPQFEAAAFSLQAGQISDPVLTVFGYHVIKLLEKTPPGTVPLDKVHDRIVDYLQKEAVQKKVPDLLTKLRKEASVEVTSRQ